MPIIERVRSAWNAFVNNPDSQFTYTGLEYSTSTFGGASPSRQQPRFQNERSIVSAIYTRLSIDVSSVPFRHIELDEFDRYKTDRKSQLNHCLTFEPNLDQGPRAWRQDIAMTLFDKGVAALVPVDTTLDPDTHEIFDIYSLRVGEIVGWYPKHVRVSVWNEQKGKRQEIVLAKRFVAIIENPLFSVMNSQNSTLQRLIRKLTILDAIDEQSGSGKLDLIIQLPYVVKTEAMRDRAEKRRADIELQLKDSKYGIAYADGTEKITQLNRPAENNLLKQIEFLTNMLYGQLGITEEVMNGTADEATMINYFNRTIEPILTSIAEGMQKSFLGLKGILKQERIKYFRDPFKLLPLAELAEITDKLTRNEVVTSNEMRGFIGIQPSTDPKADELVNSNMPQPPTEPVA